MKNFTLYIYFFMYMYFIFQDDQALLLFQTHEYWIVNFPEDFFRTETSDLVTFLDKSPTITRKSFKTDELEIDNIFHAQCYHPPKEISTTALLVAFLKVCSTKKKIFFVCFDNFFSTG